MGRKEKHKIKQRTAVSQNNAAPNPSALKNYLDSELMKLRGELSIERARNHEILVRITKELSVIHNNLALIDAALTRQNLFSKDMANDIQKQLDDEHNKMFGPDGKMTGEPVVTAYNCDFELEATDELKINTSTVQDRD